MRPDPSDTSILPQWQLASQQAGHLFLIKRIQCARWGCAASSYQKKRLTPARHSQITPPTAGLIFVTRQTRCLIPLLRVFYGAIAQLGERLLCKQEVVGSIPSGSTIAISSTASKTSLRPLPAGACFSGLVQFWSSFLLRTILLIKNR